MVYVGQTRVGLYRPFSHRDKEYNNVRILPCSETQLDDLENFYIAKYKPRYNIMGNGREGEKAMICTKKKKAKHIITAKLPKIQMTS